jgi:SAM-dependent methyltransferase
VRDARQRREERQYGSVTDNVSYNRAFWNRYSDDWDAGEIGRPSSARLLGEEWSDTTDFDAIFDDWIAPELRPDLVAGELGPGGGRVAFRVAPRVNRLHCFDISQKMLDRTQHALRERDNVEYWLLERPRLPPSVFGSLDFVYSFDVFVHLDVHTMWQYLSEFSSALRPGGRALIHTSNLAAPGGWQRFAGQDRYSVQGHYFVTPDVVHTLVAHTPLRVVRESTPDEGNVYLRRDYLAVLQRVDD